MSVLLYFAANLKAISETGFGEMVGNQ